MSAELRESLERLRRQPADPGAMAAVREALADQAGIAPEASRLLEGGRAYHGRRGAWEIVLELIDLELREVVEPQRQAELLAGRGRVLARELLDPKGAAEAFSAALAADARQSEASAGLEELEALRSGWRASAEAATAEAKQTGDGAARSAAFLKAAGIWWAHGEDRQRAEECLRCGLEAEPRNWRAARLLERLLREAGRHRELAEHMEGQLEQTANSEDRLVLLSELAEVLARELDEPSRAADYFRRALAIDPTHQPALSFLEDYLGGEERWDLLVEVYDAALACGVPPQLEVKLASRAAEVLAERLGRDDRAELFYRRLRRAQPTHPAMIAFYRRYYPEKGEPERLLGILEAAYAASGDSAARVELAREMAPLAEDPFGDLDKAIEYWKIVWRAADATSEEGRAATASLKRLYRKISPPRWNALRELIKGELDALPPDAADQRLRLLEEMLEIYRDHLKLRPMVISAYNAILAVRPDHPEAIEGLVQAYESLGRWSDLVAILERRALAEKDVSARAKTLYRIADIWTEHFGNPARAAKPLESVLAMIPAAEKATARLEEIYTKEQDWPHLYLLLERLVEHRSGEKRRETYRRMLGIAKEGMGDQARAIEVLNRMLSESQSGTQPAGSREEERQRATRFLQELAALYQSEKRPMALAETLRQIAEMADSAEEKLAALDQLGDLYRQQLGELQYATEAWQSALRIDADQPRVRHKLAAALAEWGQWDELAGLFEAEEGERELARTLFALAEECDTAELRWELYRRSAAIRLVQLHDAKGAAQCYERLLAVDPESTDALRALAGIYRELQEMARLREVCQELFEKTADSAEKGALAEEMRGLSEQMPGAGPDALKWALRAYLLSPGAEGRRETLERLAAESGAWEDLVSAYEQRVGGTDDPKERGELLDRLVEVTRDKLHWTDQAERYAQRKLSEYGNDDPSLRVLEELYRRGRRWEDLAAIMARRVDTAADLAEGAQRWLALGALQEEKLADTTAAIDSYVSALEADPTCMAALTALERLQRVRGDWAAVWEVLRRQLEVLAVGGDHEARVAALVRSAEVASGHLDDPTASLDAWEQVLALDNQHEGCYLALQGFVTLGGAAGERAARLLEPISRRRRDWAVLREVLSALLSHHDSASAKAQHLTELLSLSEHRLPDLSRAFDAACQLFSLVPTDPDHLAALDRTAERAGRKEEIAELVGSALKTARRSGGDGAELMLHDYLAKLADERLGDLDRAMASFRRIIELDPGREDAYASLARLLRQRADWGGLRDLLECWLAVSTAAAEQMRLLLLIAALNEDVLGDPKGAIHAYERALDIEPEHGQTLRALERLYRATQRWDDLVQIFDRQAAWAEEANTRAAIRVKEAKVRAEKLEDRQGALDTLLAVVMDNPRAAEAVAELERQLADRSDLEVAAQRRIAAGLARVYTETEDWRCVVDVLRLQAELAPTPSDRAEILLRTGLIEVDRLGAKEDAFRTYQAAMDLDPLNGSILEACERLGAELGMWEELSGSWRSIIARMTEEDDRDLRDTLLERLGVVELQHLERPELARQTFEALLELRSGAPTSAVAVCGVLAPLYQRDEDWEALLALLERQIEWAGTEGELEDLRRRAAEVADARLGHAEAAIPHYEALQQRASTGEEAFCALQRLYPEVGRWANLAELLWSRAEGLGATEGGELWLRAGRLYRDKLSEVDAATRCFERAAAADEPSDEAAQALAALYERAGRWRELARLLRTQLEAALGAEVRRPLLKRLGQIRVERLREKQGALEAFAELLSDGDADPQVVAAVEGLAQDPTLCHAAWETLEAAYRRWERWDDLARVLRDRWENTSSLAARRQVGIEIATLHEERRGDLDSAFEWYGRLVRAEPADPQLRGELIRVGALQARWDETAAILEEGLERAWLSDGGRNLLLEVAAVFDQQVFRWRPARRWLKRLLERDPGDEQAFTALEGLFEHYEQWTELASLYRSQADSVDEADRRADLGLRLARVLEEGMGDRDAAIDALESVYDLSASDGLVAAASVALRRLYEATQRWRPLLSLLERELERAKDPARIIELKMSIGRVVAEELGEPGWAVDCFEAVLAQAPEHPGAIASLERLIAEREVRARVTEILEAVYRRQEAWGMLVVVLQTQLAAAQDDARAVQLLSQIAELEEQRLGSPEEAFGAICQALLRDPLGEALWAEAYRLAGVVAGWPALVTLLGSVAERSYDYALLARTYERMANIHEERLGDKEAAARAWQEVLVVNDGDPRARGELERLYGELGHDEELVDLLRGKAQRAADGDQRLAVYREIASISEERLGDSVQAVENWRHVLSLDGSDAEALGALERLYAASGAWIDRIGVLRRRLELAEAVAAKLDLQLAIGRSYEEDLGDPLEASGAYRGALELEPACAEAVDSLKRLYEEAGLWADLLELLDHQIAIVGADESLAAEEKNRRVGPALMRSGVVLSCHLGDYESAVDRFEQALSIDECRVEAVEALETLMKEEACRDRVSLILEPIYEEREDLPRLTELLRDRAAATADPGAAAALWRRIGELCEGGLGDDARALAARAEALRLEPEEEANHAALTRLAREGEEAAQVIAAYDEAMEGVFDGQVARLLRVKAGELSETVLGDDARAEGYYRAALDYEADDAGVLNALDRLLSRQEKREELIKVRGQRVELADDPAERAELLCSLGDLLVEAPSRKTEAVAAYEAALDNDPAREDARRALEQLAQDPACRELCWSRLDSFYREQGMWPQLAELLLRRAEVAPDEEGRGDLLEQLAELREGQLEDAGLALDAMIGAMAARPNELRLLDEAERLANRSGRLADLATRVEALVLGDQAAEIPARRELALRLGAWCCEGLERWEGAERAYRLAIDLGGESAEALEGLERVYRQQGDPGRLARVVRSRAEAELDPLRRKDALKECAMLFKEVNEVEEAVACWENVLEADPADGDVVESLVDIYAASGRWKEALEVLARRAEFLQPGAARVVLLSRMAEIAADKLGDWRRAVSLYREAAADDDGLARVAAALAELLRTNSAWEELYELRLRELELCRGARPDSSPEERQRTALICTTLGDLCRHRLDRHDDAIVWYTEALGLDPANQRAGAALREMLGAAERWHDLAEILQRAAASAGASGAQQLAARLWGDAAEIWADAIGDAGAAAETLGRALDGLVTHDLLIRLAATQAAQGAWEAVAGALDRAEGLGPTPGERAEIAYWRGRLLEERGDGALSALPHFQAALAGHPDNPEAATALARVCASLGRWEEAARALEGALNADHLAAGAAEGRAAVMLELAGIYLDQLGAEGKGIEILWQAHRLDPEASGPLDHLVDRLVQAERLAEAEPLIARQIALAGDRRSREVARLWQRRGAVAEGVGDAKAAIGHYEAAYRLDATASDTLEALGRLYLERRQWEAARKIYRTQLLTQAEEPTPERRAAVFLGLGRAHEGLNEPQKARALYERGIETCPEVPELKEALARLHKTGD